MGELSRTLNSCAFRAFLLSTMLGTFLFNFGFEMYVLIPLLSVPFSNSAIHDTCTSLLCTR